MTKEVMIMKRLSRKANVLFFAIGIILLMSFSFTFLDQDDNEDKSEYSTVLIAEDQNLVSTYIDSISQEQSSIDYQKVDMVVEKGTKIQGVTLTSQQEFSKYMRLIGPDGEETLTPDSDQIITHYAYSLLLIGDIQEKTNLQTQEKAYEIVNARIVYDKIPFVLKDQNTVILRSESQGQEKTVELQVFINALKKVDQRQDMIS